MRGGLTVLFDQDCPLCCRARTWLGRQAALVPLKFVPAGSLVAQRLFPGLDHAATLREITVIGDQGEIYRGAKAWLMCLWALHDYREMAIRWSDAGRIEYARRFVAWVSKHRFRLSWLIGFQ
ncbi:MAG TPA: DCC1-like thiol-disulfide oxidoreductase family protein [Thermoanaerobaculia bacterium]|nr:DCC1-like thiol-disulfide oxidoreductase family protein [Thermoanaerobaculia bacterium]